MAMKPEEVLRIIAAQRGNAICVPTMISTIALLPRAMAPASALPSRMRRCASPVLFAN